MDSRGEERSGEERFTAQFTMKTDDYAEIKKTGITKVNALVKDLQKQGLMGYIPS